MWKEVLKDKIPAQFLTAIDGFETTLALKKEGKIEERIFNETRLRRGAYGQRYDNGKRHDGQEQRIITYPTRATKGPGTEWDAPGMQRIKIPYGGLNTEQMLLLADVAEEYSDDILHVTTRQDFQLHFIHIEDTPDLFRRLAAVGITTQEACGNSIRNITACPYAGVCPDQRFDASPYAHAAFAFLLGHPDAQEFGRKFKIAFSGCTDHPCGLAHMHDIGFIAKEQNGKRGFHVLVGGGLGAVPVQAKVFYDFMPEEALLKFCQGVARIFARFGEKKNRNRARMKFLINDWGIEKFKAEVETEMSSLPPDKRWTAFLKDIPEYKEEVKKNGPQTKSPAGKQDEGFSLWMQHNTRTQPQPGLVVVTICLPLGDITANQMRSLAHVARKYINDTIRTTVWQNLVLRNVRSDALPSLYADLKAIALADPHHKTIEDITACPGTDTCKLGVSSSRGLASELKRQLHEGKLNIPQAVRDLNIKVSGCFNSCGQHHIADIGFYGISRKVGDYLVPYFQLLLGGESKHNAQSYGLATVAIPSKAVPKAIEKLAQSFAQNKQDGERFQGYLQRLGKIEIKTLLDPFTTVPPHDEAPEYYTDWGDTRTYSKKDIGIGECAGEVISGVQFALTTAGREVFEAQVAYEGNRLKEAHAKALSAMQNAALGLVRTFNQDAKADLPSVQAEFKTLLVDSKKFLDPFAGDKFAKFFLTATPTADQDLSKDRVHNFLEETQLFIDACHAYEARKSL